MEDHLSALIATRPAFGDSSEAEQLFCLTDEALQAGDIDWLEVGAGNGRHLLAQLNRLSPARYVNVVAIEPAADAPLVLAHVDWRRTRIEDYQPERRFDWINIRHSLYYFKDPVAEIVRLSSFLSSTGAIAITHWADDCVLHRLHLAITGCRSGLAGAGVDAIAAELTSNASLTFSPVQTHKTSLLVAGVRHDPALAAALYDLARRGMPATLPVGTDPGDFITDELRRIDSPDIRINGFLLIRRATN